jgi:leucyl aminopeptidase
MQLTSVLLLTLPFLVSGNPIPGNDEVVLGGLGNLLGQVPVGYSVELDEKRLVQFEGKEPVWMTEREKVTGVTPRYVLG